MMSSQLPNRDPRLDTTVHLPTPTEIDEICERFVRGWQKGQRPQIEEFLSKSPVAGRSVLLVALLREEVALRRQSGESLTIDHYLSRFPQERHTVERVFTSTDEPAGADSTFSRARSFEEQTQNGTVVPVSATGPGTQAGQRYRKVRELGEGAFGTVWLAEDLELRRHVALKEPRNDRLRTSTDIETWLSEARVLASLDHPHIVPVYDFGRTPEGSCYVVSKLIDGKDLAAHVKEKRLSFDQAVELVASVADALQQTHSRGLVHRDLKPGNILVDVHGRPYVTDFGLALREEDLGKDQGFAGTPAYMSPEQARGEGHLVDGRSDIFSLGVVLYELLTGTKPFSGSNWGAILVQITTVEARPLRQRNESIPKELERICLKALSKRAADRYSCAADLAEDLRHWSSAPAAAVRKVASDLPPVASARIVPKGLRSFDAGDGDFFLQLLPGARDRDGLPESLRFWKTRIEENDPDQTFRVGLVYGPSGCGKSSLMKAGLLPRLADHVIRVFLEATPDQTEQQLLQRVRRACADFPPDASLAETLSAIRRGKGIPARHKILIVLDQFEQWLYANDAEQNTELAKALRQCDGQRIQAVLLVRDDFWVPVSEFMRAIEIRVIEGANAGLVSLFDTIHARKVLAEFGKAYGRLPEDPGQLTEAQEAFLNQSVSGLAQDGKVICVRLALFADMMKGREWTPATLQEVGGTAGIGTTFLEETFSSRTAPPHHRLHQEAARAILRALLPVVGTDIKLHMRTSAELQEAIGYSKRPNDFMELIRILDGEVRLLTPVSVDGQEPAYQLTHDYLVPSLREWLTRKQRETRKGQAELKLEERTALWTAKPENRHLPSLLEYLSIRTLIRARNWTESQASMMMKASRFHALRCTIGTVILCALLLVALVVRTNVLHQQEAILVQGLVRELANADPAEVPGIAEQLRRHPEVAPTLLTTLLSREGIAPDERRARLHAQMASVPQVPSLVDPLVEELLNGKVTYIQPIRQQLRPYAVQLTERFRSELGDEQAATNRRFRAAIALAEFVRIHDQELWSENILTFVATELVSANPEYQPLLRASLHPIHVRLLPAIVQIFGDAKATTAQRLGAANAVADWAGADVDRLVQLLTISTPEQFSVIYPLVETAKSPVVIQQLHQIASTVPTEGLGSLARLALGQQRANAAIALIRLGEAEKAMSVFEITDDPESLTQFIFGCQPRGVSVTTLVDAAQMVISSKDRYPKYTLYGLLLTLGEFRVEEIAEAPRERLLGSLRDLYAHDKLSSVHGASGWLLSLWGQQEFVRKIDQTAIPYAAGREWFTVAINVRPTEVQKSDAEPDQISDSESVQKKLFFTFIVFPAGTYTVGAPDDEPGRFDRDNREQRHSVKLSQTFAVLNREITYDELIAFHPDFFRVQMAQFDSKVSEAGTGLNWYNSIMFCRWLGKQAQLDESKQAYPDPESLDENEYPREPGPIALGAPMNWPIMPERPGFRLPLDAEWEVAARGGTRTAFCFGGDGTWLKKFGWYEENSGGHEQIPAQLRPNLRGLFDVHGNLSEWTHDWYSELSLDRLFRGGNWDTRGKNCRLADRATQAPAAASYVHGLRMTLSLTDESVSSERETEDISNGTRPAK